MKYETCQKCERGASFGPFHGPKIHCWEHRKRNDYKKNRPQCIFCPEYATYYLPNRIPEFCFEHSPQGVLELNNMKCSKCRQFHSNLYERLCPQCTKPKKYDITFQFPNTIFKSLKDLVTKPIYVFSQNPHFITVVELDETPLEIWNRIRMINILQEIGDRPGLWIRNPDDVKYLQNTINATVPLKHKYMLVSGASVEPIMNFEH